MRSRPTRASSTFCGTLPLRKPGILVLAARSEVACSTACFTWSLGTSTSRRTRLSGSSSTFVFTVRPFCQHASGLGPAAQEAAARSRFLVGESLVRFLRPRLGGVGRPARSAGRYRRPALLPPCRGPAVLGGLGERL